MMLDGEIVTNYEENTGKIIVECFHSRGIDPNEIPAVLVASHGPFAWGPTIENAIVLEAIAHMQLCTQQISGRTVAGEGIPEVLLRNFFCKHGPKTYYGQQ